MPLKAVGSLNGIKLSTLIRWLAGDEEKSFRGGEMCQEIMAPQVEYGEETLAPTEADETQQRPEKSRCALVYLHSLERGMSTLSESGWVFCAHAPINACSFFVREHTPACQRSHFVSCRSWFQGSVSSKTNLRGLIISSERLLIFSQMLIII